MTARRSGWCLGVDRHPHHVTELADNEHDLELCAPCYRRWSRTDPEPDHRPDQQDPPPPSRRQRRPIARLDPDPTVDPRPVVRTDWQRS